MRVARLPLFVLLGDPFLCEEKRKEILLSLERDYGPGLPLTIRRAGEGSIDPLLSEARTLPFLARAQVFCVRDADQFTQTDLERWKAYFKSPHPETFFIFEAESLDRGHPFLEGAERAGQLFSLRRESGRLAQQFIREKLKRARKRITPEALERLESRVGDSFLFLDSLVDQLILQAGEKPEIDRSAVEALEERLHQFEGYDLIQALAERNLPKALEILDALFEVSGEDAPSLVGLLHWQLRRFWEAKKLLDQGRSEQEVATRLRISPQRGSAFLSQLRGFSREELEKTLEGLFNLDWRLKTGRAGGRLEIESWLVQAVT